MHFFKILRTRDIFFCMVCLSSAKAQEKYYLEYRNKGFGLLNKSYFLNDSKITKDSVAKLLERDNKSAYYMFTKGRKNLTGAILIVIPSMVLLTTEVLRPFNNGANEEPALIIAASAGVVGSIVLAFIADGQFEKAAKLYNRGNISTGKVHVSFGITNSGSIGLMLCL